MLSQSVSSTTLPVLSLAKATDTLRRRTEKLIRREHDAILARREWEEAVLLAQMAGMSVLNIAALVGKSAPRIEQVLAAEKKARGITATPRRTAVPKAVPNNHPKEGSK